MLQYIVCYVPRIVWLTSFTTGFRLFLHGAIVLPLIYLVLAQSNPFTVIRGVLPALRTALLLSSR